MASKKATKRKLFGTDGIRGRANEYPMTSEVAMALGRAVAHQAKKGTHRQRIVIGKDTRISGYMLEMALASGVCSMGADALLVGTLPTPAVAFLTQSMRADAGIMISASHNSYEDNGIKIFARDGYKLPDETELELEALIKGDMLGTHRPPDDGVGKCYRLEDSLGRYIVHLKTAFPTGLDLDGLKVVIDCANGAGYRVAPLVAQELGATVLPIGVAPNGRNINGNCGALHTAGLSAAVRENKADIGLALDGDADRLVVVDNLGHVVNGDCLLALGAHSLQQTGMLQKGTMVATVMSNLALEKSAKEFGVCVVRTQVGDRYVVELMRRNDYNYGGEQSGHVVYTDHATTGDGMVAALKLLAMLAREKTPLSELQTILKPFPQVLVNIGVNRKPPLTELTGVQSTIQRIENELGADGRVMVRYSGTEHKLRILVEGPDTRAIEAWAGEIAEEVKLATG